MRTVLPLFFPSCLSICSSLFSPECFTCQKCDAFFYYSQTSILTPPIRSSLLSSIWSHDLTACRRCDISASPCSSPPSSPSSSITDPSDDCNRPVSTRSHPSPPAPTRLRPLPPVSARSTRAQPFSTLTLFRPPPPSARSSSSLRSRLSGVRPRRGACCVGSASPEA